MGVKGILDVFLGNKGDGYFTRERATAGKDKRMKNDKKMTNVKPVEIGTKRRIISSGKFGVLK